MMKRLFDLTLSILGLVILSAPIVVVYILVTVTSNGPAIFWSKRVGRHATIFLMPKFRSMRIGTPQVATHIMNQENSPDSFLTPVGNFIRKTSLDELPQLWSVLKGDMSIVGPRPALFNQDDLISMRADTGVHKLKPGITGWAQVNGRDEIPIPKKVELDTYYLTNQSFWLDCRIIFLTIVKVIKKDDVSH
jgi:O-antigen biosynthesis protein WbqP